MKIGIIFPEHCQLAQSGTENEMLWPQYLFSTSSSATSFSSIIIRFKFCDKVKFFPLHFPLFIRFYFPCSLFIKINNSFKNTFVF